MIVTSQQLVLTQHVTIESGKSFDEVKAALESIVPHLDHWSGLDGAKLSILLSLDQGALLQRSGRSQKALQYDIGNPISTTRVMLYEDDGGRARFEYDKPSSLFGRFDGNRDIAASRRLESALERALLEAAS